MGNLGHGAWFVGDWPSGPRGSTSRGGFFEADRDCVWILLCLQEKTALRRRIMFCWCLRSSHTFALLSAKVGGRTGRCGVSSAQKHPLVGCCSSCGIQRQETLTWWIKRVGFVYLYLRSSVFI